MIVQEDVPYTKEEVKAMVKTIHDLREKLSLLGWHPASELPIIPKGEVRSVELAVYCKQANTLVLRNAVYYANGHWSELNVKWWCYPPKEE